MATTFQSGVGKIAGTADIDGLKTPQLVQLFNELSPDKTVKKFADRKAAVKRVKAAFTAWQETQGAPKKTRAVGETPTSGRTYRPDSKRGKIIELASIDGGTTFGKLKKATGWESDEVAAALNRIKSYNGLTVVVEGEGDDRTVQITGELRTRKAFSFPPKAEIRPLKEDTKRSRVAALLLSKDGATFSEIQKEIGWDDRTTYEGIRLIHSYLGYGLREDADGRIHAYTGNAKILEKPAKAEKPVKAAKRNGNKAA